MYNRYKIMIKILNLVQLPRLFVKHFTTALRISWTLKMKDGPKSFVEPHVKINKWCQVQFLLNFGIHFHFNIPNFNFQNAAELLYWNWSRKLDRSNPWGGTRHLGDVWRGLYHLKLTCQIAKSGSHYFGVWSLQWEERMITTLLDGVLMLQRGIKRYNLFTIRGTKYTLCYYRNSCKYRDPCMRALGRSKGSQTVSSKKLCKMMLINNMGRYTWPNKK